LVGESPKTTHGKRGKTKETSSCHGQPNEKLDRGENDVKVGKRANLSGERRGKAGGGESVRLPFPRGPIRWSERNGKRVGSPQVGPMERD